MTHTAIAFVAVTMGLWAVGMCRLASCRHEHKLNSFFLGMFVMSFAGIWISVFTTP